MIPRIDDPPRQDRTYCLRPGVYAVLPRAGRVLLTVQWDDVPDIQLPGGGIDAGESALPALHREVLEETGWRIAAPRRLGAFRRFAYMPEYDLWAEKLCHVYVARPVRALTAPSEPDHEALWLPVADAIHALGNDGDRLFLDRYRRLAQPR
jgi:8-oxo-dGTP diphosphatase